MYEIQNKGITCRAIPVVGGIRTAILSLVAFTKLCDAEITKDDTVAGDVVKFFYCATGMALRKPNHVRRALELFPS